MTVLVTGGAGYIGSHVVRMLQERGENVVVVDDLSSGDASRIGDAKLVQVDISSDDAVRVLSETMIDDDVDAVIHFAAKKQVGESVKRPAMYYKQNVGGMANLMRAMYDAGVRDIVFSSSAAVYGMPDVTTIAEDAPKEPINPYGRTKLIGEQMLADGATGWDLNYLALRYFNAAGTGWGDLADTATMNLIPIALDALARGDAPVVFGDDYATPDGSCIRDYIHVHDLARAHLHSLDALREGKVKNRAFNVGTGTGSSVFEVLDGVRDQAGFDFDVEVGPRRAGDPAALIANCAAIEDELGWKAQLGLEDILESAWQARQNGPKPVPVPEPDND